MTKNNIPVHRPKTVSEFQELNREMNNRRYVAIDVLKSGKVKTITSALSDAAEEGAMDLQTAFDSGNMCSGPIGNVAWAFDTKTNAIEKVQGKDGKELGLGYVKWGKADNIPNIIPPLAMSLPYTAAPLRYTADLTAGLGVRLMFHFPDGSMCEFRDAGERLRKEAEAEKQAAAENNTYHGVELLPRLGESSSKEEGPAQKLYAEWISTWYGEDVRDEDNSVTHIPGAKEFIENNNLDLHMMQCEQDDVMLDIYFPTVGLQRGRPGRDWEPKIVSVSVLPSHSVRLELMNEFRHINHVYFSDSFRNKGVGGRTEILGTSDTNYILYPAAMPQERLKDLRYIVEKHRRSRVKARPTWIVCPTFYPSGNKPYYPQPTWWSVFTSKAFDFSSTILYDKAKQRENVTTWGKILYVSLDYLNQVFADEGLDGNQDAQDEFISDLETKIEDFLKHRENQGKMMRQWMWTGPDGKEHYSVEIADVKETTNDAVKAGKEELELSTSPIFLALQVDPRLVGVPMVAPSNGGTALRELHLLKQQQLSVKQRLLLSFYNDIVHFNRWSEHAEFVIVQQTLTTLDNSKTGTVETIAGKES